MTEIAAIDIFVVATATFRLPYALIVLRYDQKTIIYFDVTEDPTQAWLARQTTETFRWDISPCYLLRDCDASYG